jgi:hypothetical protein
MRYFRIRADDQRFPDKWFLGEPLTAGGEDLDAREFTYGQPYTGTAPADVPVNYLGTLVQFNLGAFDMPVVSEAVAALLRQTAPDDCEWFPVTIGSGLPGYLIMNAVFREACLDERRSRLERYTPEHGDPDKVGRYRMMYHLMIDPVRTHNRHVFRVEGWIVQLIVSERIKDAIETIHDLGIEFEPAS